MQGRFSRIFELFNQRNTEYYQQAFDRLEKENKTTFNFAAGFYWAAWLVFRKMYRLATLFILVYGGIMISLNEFCQNSKTVNLISAVLFLVIFLGFGFFGNSLYYKHVKSKIAKGYAKITDYNSIDPIWGIVVVGLVVKFLSGIFSGIFAVTNVGSKSVLQLLVTLMQVFFIAIPWAIDHKKFHSQESVEPVEVTDESVNVYLEKANPKRLTVSMGIYVISYLLLLPVVTVVAVAGMKYTGKKILSQLDKIAEGLDEVPNEKAKKGTKILDDKEIKKQLDEIDKLNKRIIEKQKLGKTSETDESMRKDLDALCDAWAKLAKDVKKKKNSPEVPAKTAEHRNSQVKSVKIEAIVAKSDGTVDGNSQLKSAEIEEEVAD